MFIENTVILSDLDDTLVPQDGTLQSRVLELLKRINQVIPVSILSGKPLWHVLREVLKFGGKIAFAEGGGIWQMVGQEPEIVDTARKALRDLEILKKALGLKSNPNKWMQDGLKQINRNGRRIVFIEGPKHTIFTPVGVDISGKELRDIIARIIEEEGLHLTVSAPFANNAVDVIPQGLTKACVVEVIQKLFGADVRIIALGDGISEIPLFRESPVFPITFSNVKKEVKQAVRKRGGIITEFQAPQDGLAVAEGLLTACRLKELPKSKGKIIAQIIREIYPEL